MVIWLLAGVGQVLVGFILGVIFMLRINRLYDTPRHEWSMQDHKEFHALGPRKKAEIPEDDCPVQPLRRIK